jgi:magnesium-dependent phosphatase 1
MNRCRSNIHERSGIAYEDMVFFDNERRNVTDCRSLGITCVYTPDGG